MRGAPTRTLTRVMQDGDIPQAAEVSAAAFELDITAPSVRRRWEERMRHSLRTDPAGSFVTQRGPTITGVAQAVIRDGIWILSVMAASPTLARGGEGRALMDAALDYYDGCRGGLIISSNDPRALRLYGSAGFALEPAFRASGAPDLSLMPESGGDVAPVAPEDFPRLAPISLAVRGAAHTLDLPAALARGGSVFALDDRGFVVTVPGRGVWAVAARDERAASTLLWHGLAQLGGDPRVEIGWISGAQRWALEVVLAARLSLSAYGGIALRGEIGPMYPYIPSPSFA